MAIDHIVKLSTHLAPTLLHPLQVFQGCFRDVPGGSASLPSFRFSTLPRNHRSILWMDEILHHQTDG
jgi:hypothetical protein